MGHIISPQASPLAPYLCPLDKLLSGSTSVVPLSSPGIEGRCLQGTSIGEGEGPGPGKWAAIDGIEVEGCLLFALTPGQESHSWRRQTDWSLCFLQGKGSLRHRKPEVRPEMIGAILYLGRLGAQYDAGQ